MVTDEHRLVSVNARNSVPGLVFGLASGAPDGARIDPVLGVFTWLPEECQGPSTNTIVVTVTDPDSRLQPLDFRSFQVIVNEVNDPPILDPISPQFLEADVPVSFTATVYDPDCPVKQTLAFNLEAGAPDGAVIDPVTGLFTWTPTAAQAGVAHTITVRVTDDGNPPLSSTMTFTALPPPLGPRLALERLADGGVRLTIDGGPAGAEYTIQAAPELKVAPAQTQWKPLKVVRPGQVPFSFDDDETATLPKRFYRVLWTP
jgi:hypothetical protein